jgi:hypothetical protein
MKIIFIGFLILVGYQQLQKSGDQGGHLFGSQFDGPGEQINLEPMKSSINGPGGSYYQMETEWKNALNASGNASGTVTDIDIIITRGANNRAIRFEIDYKINGIQKPTKTIDNF